VGDVFGEAGRQIVEADDLVPFAEEPLAQVRADEPGSARDDDAHCSKTSWQKSVGA